MESSKKIQVNLFAKWKQTHKLWETYGYQREQEGAGRDGLGVWDWHMHRGMWNDWSTGTYCIAQRPLSNIRWSWENNLKENEDVCTYKQITFLYRRNYHNLVNQLYLNRIFLKWKKLKNNSKSYTKCLSHTHTHQEKKKEEITSNTSSAPYCSVIMFNLISFPSAVKMESQQQQKQHHFLQSIVMNPEWKISTKLLENITNHFHEYC